MGILNTKKLTFNISDYTLNEISDAQIMELEMYVVSEGENKHNMPISRDAIINSAETIIGKPVLFKYNKMSKDLMGHEVDEIACGVCGLTKDDYYFKEVDGKLWLIVKAYIWKMYFEEVVDVFVRDEEKAISMEMFIVDSEDDEDDETLIESFCFSGVTLLGKIYNPAIPNANAKVIKYSEESFSNMVNETKKILFSNIDTDTTKKEVEEVKKLKKFNKKEFVKQFSLTANEMFELFESSLSSVTYKEEDYECKKYWVRDFNSSYVFARDWESGTSVAIPYTFSAKQPSFDFTSVKYARLTYVVDEEEEEEEKEDVVQMYADRVVKQELEKATQLKEKEIKEYSSKVENLEKEKAEFTEKITNLENNIENSDKQITEYSAKIEDLEKTNNDLLKFKESIEEQERQNKIKFAINSVKDTLTDKQVKEWESKVDTFESIEAFINAIQAFAYTQVKHTTNEDEINRIHIPQEPINDSKKGLWD